ncbi:virulence-associated E family protein [Hyphomicrobium sp.]|uniref:virulence-associated E family protein n=1 Tax=Hyphomicrobium sp. TaxID=82 RepID=UPI0025C485B3|nr:virulence-associated E family protein [Hyphomicrobium sp.]MCC7253182.1 virulence-associated E family protein [Hyphomicrobium sp.]
MWRNGLIVGPTGPRANVANAIHALRYCPLWAGVLAFDEHAMRTVALKAPPWDSVAHDHPPRTWTPRDDVLATKWFQHANIGVALNIAQQAIETVAQDATFHPIRDYLGSLEWDRKPRVDRFAGRYLGAVDTLFARSVGRAFLVSAVARVYRPGAKADHMLILEGPQGRGKSSALAALAQPWHSDELADLGSKDAAMQARAAWLIEIAELESMNRADVSKIKAFLSRTTDRFRPPYGSRIIEVPRQCVFAGSTNSDTYLRDETGGRRFWPIKVGRIDLNAIRRDRDQIWAEAVALFKAGERWWLEGSAATLASHEQMARLIDDPWDALIDDFVHTRQNVSIPEILQSALKLDEARWDQTNRNRVARCLLSRGWERYQFRAESGKREWRYKRGALQSDLDLHSQSPVEDR